MGGVLSMARRARLVTIFEKSFLLWILVHVHAPLQMPSCLSTQVVLTLEHPSQCTHSTLPTSHLSIPSHILDSRPTLSWPSVLGHFWPELYDFFFPPSIFFPSFSSKLCLQLSRVVLFLPWVCPSSSEGGKGDFCWLLHSMAQSGLWDMLCHPTNACVPHSAVPGGIGLCVVDGTNTEDADIGWVLTGTFCSTLYSTLFPKQRSHSIQLDVLCTLRV